jgi:small-conductance mechanosensitive channel
MNLAADYEMSGSPARLKNWKIMSGVGVRWLAGIGVCFLSCVTLGVAQQVNSDAVIGHLNAILKLYRSTTIEIQNGANPSDVIYQENERILVADAVRLAFQAAKAESAVIRSAEKNAAGGASGPAAAQGSAQFEAKNNARIAELQSKMDELDQQISKTAKNKRATLISQKQALQGELNLDQAVAEVIQKRVALMESNSDTASEGLDGRINQLGHSEPGLQLSPTPGDQKTAPKPAGPEQAKQPPSGLVAQALALYGVMTTVHQIDQLNAQTLRVKQTVTELRQPIRDLLVADLKKGRDLSDQAMASQTPTGAPQDFQNLTEHFKELAAVVLPLSQEIIVLDQSSANLQEWRTSIIRESKYSARSLLVRVLGLVLALGFVLAFSEGWQRLTYKYIQDTRRRRQFLLLRRFVTGFMVGIVLIMGFVSEFSSLATFAGFVTAGIAVGLQTVLLSVAAYFFVIGRYGIHVGDRISVAGVTGDVIDISLVRLYLIELAGTGIDLYPTGRVVVLSNSVLFQATAPLFKQIPGTEYAWHEVVLNLTSGANYKVAQDKLLATVNEVFDKFRPNLERQHGEIERRIEVQLKAPVPEARLQFGDTGLELMVRYPVEIRNESEMDEQVTRKVLEMIQGNPEVQAAVPGSPKIRAAIRG